MSREKISKGGAWTDAEKLTVIFSLMEASGKIEWAKARIPEGRTLKAAMHMLTNEKSKLSSVPDEASNDEANGGGPVKPPKTPKIAAPKTPKTGSSAKGSAKRKRAAMEDEDGDYYEGTVKPEHDEVKKIKQELKETAKEFYKLEKAGQDEQAEQTEQLLQAAESTVEA